MATTTNGSKLTDGSSLVFKSSSPFTLIMR